MSAFGTILTHPGSAHKDEFLACSVLLAVHPAPILRREPTPADLADASIAVVDVGHAHDPALHNFDHHQLPKDHPPTCSLSLVLQHLGLYEDARQFCDWLEPAEWFDCRGPIATAQWLGVERDAISKLNSPIDGTLLRRFAQANRLLPGEPLWEVMRMIGEDLLTYVRSLRERLDFIARHAEVWDLNNDGDTHRVLFLPRTDPLPDDPSAGLERFIESRGLGREVIGMIAPDRRSGGYGLSRYRDDARLDFTRIAACPDVHFAHARGFVAKTSATTPERLRALVTQALITPSGMNS
ncbi:MAG: MYG1 family protein [Verrucomicrobia bacterium]|nr:MYG1 family protein [Verrucomicrobiota bacterium]